MVVGSAGESNKMIGGKVRKRRERGKIEDGGSEGGEEMEETRSRR